MDDLKQTKPGQAYSILKKMGAQPGDCIDSNTFTLPAHESESLTDLQSAERIATHFAAISQEFPPLEVSRLPVRVQTQLQTDVVPPEVSVYDTYLKILFANKSKSGVPGDLPKTIVKEFAPELATTLCKIINNIVKSGQWPLQWKLEYVTAIGKIPLHSSAK